ncbi:unnamed protein product [Rotaria sp. Silwood2]|nr:unnamed protein product [Rotaria sp. Silwood2]
MSNDARQKNYKHRGLDSEELRKRREDLNITLRKQKREEQHFKRRNLASTNEPETSAQFGVAGAGTQSTGPTEPMSYILTVMCIWHIFLLLVKHVYHDLPLVVHPSTLTADRDIQLSVTFI